MKKLSQNLKEKKDWVKDHSLEILTYGVTGISVIGAGIVMYKLHKMDTKHVNVKLPEIMQEDTSVDILALNDIPLHRIGEKLLDEIMKQHDNCLDPEALVNLSIVYSVDE